MPHRPHQVLLTGGHLAKCYVNSSSQQHQLQRRHLRLREAEQLAYDHTTKETLNQDLSSCSGPWSAHRQPWPSDAYFPNDSPPNLIEGLTWFWRVRRPNSHLPRLPSGRGRITIGLTYRMGCLGRPAQPDSSRSMCLLDTFPNADLMRKRQEGEGKRVHTDPQGQKGWPQDGPSRPIPVLPPGLLRSGRHRVLLVRSPSPKATSCRPPAPFDERKDEGTSGWEEVGQASLPPLPLGCGRVGTSSAPGRVGLRAVLQVLSAIAWVAQVCAESVWVHTRVPWPGNSQTGSQP